MHPRTIEEIAKDYYIGLDQAFKVGKINPAKFHFADDIRIIGPMENIEGKSQVLKMFDEKFVPMVDKQIQHHQFCDRSSVCTILDCITKKPHVTIPAAEWLKIKNGVIYEIKLFYDSAKWTI